MTMPVCPRVTMWWHGRSASVDVDVLGVPESRAGSYMGVRSYTGVVSHAGVVDDDGIGDVVEAGTGEHEGEAVGDGPGVLAEVEDRSSGVGVQAAGVSAGVVDDEAGTCEPDGETSGVQTGG